MDKESNSNDDILFDRLVDGELSAVERRRLLASLDDRGDGWRRCALAFLEAQSWGENFRDVATETPSLEVASSADKSPAAGRRFFWVAIAASLLAAFILGDRWRNDAMITNAAPRPDQGIATLTRPPETSPGDASQDDALTLWVRDDTGQTRPLRVPLVDAGTIDRQLGVTFQPGMPDAVRNRLQERGFDVQSRRRYAPLWLENGRPMIVPVEDTKIVPVNQVW